MKYMYNMYIQLLLKSRYWPCAVAHACNPSTLGGWDGWIIWGSGVQDQLGQHGEDPSTKNTNKETNKYSQTWWWACNPSCLGGWGRKIAWTWEAEVAVGRDCATALCTPAWATRAKLHLKNKRRRSGERERNTEDQRSYIF